MHEYCIKNTSKNPSSNSARNSQRDEEKIGMNLVIRKKQSQKQKRMNMFFDPITMNFSEIDSVL